MLKFLDLGVVEGKMINFMKVENGMFKHRQLEQRDGKIFLRMKQRLVVSVKDAS